MIALRKPLKLLSHPVVVALVLFLDQAGNAQAAPTLIVRVTSVLGPVAQPEVPAGADDRRDRCECGHWQERTDVDRDGWMDLAGYPTRRGPSRSPGFTAVIWILIATHMYVWSTEADVTTGERRETDLTPRHTAGIDWLWDLGGRGRLGVELFYTGRQQLHDSPYRQRTEAYLAWGVIGEWRVGRARLFFNAENLGDVRQTRFDPLVLPSRRPDGRWTDDVWAPLDGRTLNAGVRVGF